MSRNRHSNRNRNPKPRTQERLRAWYVEPIGKIAEPVTFLEIGGRVQVIRDDLASAREIVRDVARQAGAALVEVDGVEGIAAVDPHWDGRPVFVCRDAGCNKVHDVHLMVAENLYARAA